MGGGTWQEAEGSEGWTHNRTTGCDPDRPCRPKPEILPQKGGSGQGEKQARGPDVPGHPAKRRSLAADTPPELRFY